MPRVLFAFAAVGLTTAAAYADAKVDQAVRTFRQTGYNSYKMQTYCRLSDAVEAQGDRDDEASDAALEPYLDRLGPAFEDAWETAEEVDENSADGRRLNAELEALDNRCPDDGDDDDDAADDDDDAADAADTIGGIVDTIRGGGDDD